MEKRKGLKTGVKLLGGFAIVALICFGVGFTSFIMSKRTGQIMNNVSELDEAAFSLSCAMSGHLTWKAGLEELFTGNEENVKVQMDGHKCYYGQWFYGEGFEKLELHSTAAAHIIKNLEQTHLDLHDTAQHIDSIWIQNHPGLSLVLTQRLSDHQKWALEVANAVLENRYAAVETDPTQCAFGQFLSGRDNQLLEQNWEEYRSIMTVVRIHHDRLHESVIDINRQDSLAAKSVIYRSTTVDELESVEENFMKIINLEEELNEQQNAAMVYYRENTLPLLASMEDSIKKAVEAVNEDIDIFHKQVKSARRIQNIVIWVGILAGLALAILLGIVVTRDIVRQLGHEPAEIASIAEEVASGDLSYHYEDSNLRGVYNSMKMMSNQLTRIVMDVMQASDMVDSGSEQLSTSAQQLSSGTSEQASSIEEVSASMEQLVSNIEQNAENARNSDQIARKAATDATEGGTAVNRTVEAMKKIAERISVIEDIARNTNMLALNAAIEAARAGEAGKGFAVVASEVRKLAENSQKAAGEITEIASSSVDTAEQAEDIINRLVPDIQKTSDLVQEITFASEEQKKGAEQINSALNQLNSIIQQNASASEEMASMSEELSGQATQLKVAMDYFTLDGKNLNASDSVLSLPDKTQPKQRVKTSSDEKKEKPVIPEVSKPEEYIPVKKETEVTEATDADFEEF